MLSVILFRGKFRSPFQQARIFLSHSWKDNQLSDRLYDNLANEFSLYYDRAPKDRIRERPIQFGESIVPRSVINTADFFLFLASANSMSKSSNAFNEFTEALSSPLIEDNRIGIVALEDFDVPSDYSNNLYLRYELSNDAQNSEELIEALKRRLAIIGGITYEDGASIGGANPSAIVELLHSIQLIGSPTRKSLYPLSVGIPKYRIDKLITYIKGLPKGDFQEIVLKLVDIYLWGKAKDERIARTNAVYMLSRLVGIDQSLSYALLSRPPSQRDPFSYRSFLVAQCFMGAHELLDEYSDELLWNRTATAHRHRAHNMNYHLYHYGTKQAALAQLRHSIKNIERPQLARLNVATLATMSHNEHDIELIEMAEDKLIHMGINRKFINSAYNLIFTRIKRA